MSAAQDDRGAERSIAGPAEGPGARPAGPVTGEGTPSSQAAGDVPSPAPPTGDAEQETVPLADVKSSPDAAQDVEADFDQLLEDVKRERDDYLELAKRTKADFENYRKRMTSEVQAALARGKGELARDVVPVLDDLERAIQAAGLDPEGDSEDALAHGVLLVFRSLRETLRRNGIEAVDPKGEKFDPHAHEALSTVKADGAEAGTVVEVMQKGYRLDGLLIRPARVVVSE